MLHVFFLIRSVRKSTIFVVTLRRNDRITPGLWTLIIATYSVGFRYSWKFLAKYSNSEENQEIIWTRRVQEEYAYV